MNDTDSRETKRNKKYLRVRKEWKIKCVRNDAREQLCFYPAPQTVASTYGVPLIVLARLPEAQGRQHHNNNNNIGKRGES